MTGRSHTACLGSPRFYSAGIVLANEALGNPGVQIVQPRHSMSPPPRPWPRRLLPFAQFAFTQAAWFACVLGAARGQPGWGIAVAAVVVVLNFLVSDRRRADAALLLLALAIGLAWDTLLLRLQVVVYAAPGPLAGWAPGWILALWALFAVLVRQPMAWLHGRPLLAAALGAVGGPLSYASAVALGAGTLPDRPMALVVLAVGWAAITPVLTEAARALSARATAPG